MVDASRFAPYNRKAYLATVAERDRPAATRLCKALEAVFPKTDIQLYTGFPIVVRDGEWIAGFAMRAKCPMVYCCSPAVLKRMGPELKPLMSGKSCLELRAKGGLTFDEAFALVERAFAEASKSPGTISKTDAKLRERRRASSSKKVTKKAESATSTSKKSTRKAAGATSTSKKTTKKTSGAKSTSSSKATRSSSR